MKLHIGGEEIKSGWNILNIYPKPGVDFIGDISNLSQFDDESVEEVYAREALNKSRFQAPATFVCREALIF